MAEKNYSGDYSESGLWAHIKKYAKKAGYELIKNVLILYYALPEASAADKAIIIAALGYFISPIDAIPDVTPIVGFTDDAGVVAGAVARIRMTASSSVITKAEDKCREWFG
jgi:uncharacterized membrane protein YkvA (DUF1232 family)